MAAQKRKLEPSPPPLIVWRTWLWQWCFFLLLLWANPADQQQQQQSPASVPLMTTFDATWDAMKCAMKISLIQLSKYHNNQMSCCGLWMAKWFIKMQADQYCDRPDGAKAIFDQVINEDLIYNQMVRSVLGDPTLSCRQYPEGSNACTRLWIMIAILVAAGVATMLALFCGCCCITVFWCRTRRENHRLRAKMNSGNDESPAVAVMGATAPPPPATKSSAPDTADLTMNGGVGNIYPPLNHLRQRQPFSPTPPVQPPARESSSAKSNGGMQRNLRNHFVRPIQVHDSANKIPIEQYIGRLDSMNDDDNEVLGTAMASRTNPDPSLDHLSGDLKV